MAGPYKDKKGVSVDEIMQAGLQGTGVGAPTSTATASTPPIPSPGNPMNGANTQTGRGLSIDVTAPDWAWRPTQQDFGQVDVRRGQYDTGMVPTVNAQMPFSALANRQQAINQRKAALEAKMAQYDPYGGIGKAHDRYQYAFNKWATGYIDNKRKELADQMFGGDMRETDKFLGTDPMGQNMLKKWGSTANSIGTTNKAVTDSNIDLLAKVTSGELYVPPQYLDPIVKSASATGADGMPVQGINEDEFLGTLNEAEARLREVQYIDQVVAPAMDEALKTMTGVSIAAKRKGGKLVLTEREEKSFDDALRYFVNSEDGQDFVRAYHGGDKASALEALKSFYPTSIVEDVTLESPYSPPSGSGSGKNQIAQRAYNVTYSQLPQDVFNVTQESPVVGPNGKPIMDPVTKKPMMRKESVQKEGLSDAVKEEFPTIDLYDVVSDQARFATARSFRTYGETGNVGGKDVYMHPTGITKIGDKLFIVGKETGAPKSRPATGAEDVATDTEMSFEQFSKLPSKIVPYRGNEHIIEQSFPWLDDQGIRDALGSGAPKKKSGSSKPKDSDPLGIL